LASKIGIKLVDRMEKLLAFRVKFRYFQ